jgi:hypothetical protein
VYASRLNSRDWAIPGALWQITRLITHHISVAITDLNSHSWIPNYKSLFFRSWFENQSYWIWTFA